MSRAFVRGIQTTTRTLMQFAGGVRPSDLISQNGGHGPEWEMAARIVTQAIEKADPRISVTNIQGARAHFSSKDRADKQMVITIGLSTASGTRVGSVHVHMDGSFKFFPSRIGKEGGYDANISRARIAGHINNPEEEIAPETKDEKQGGGK
ncbi:Transcription factor S-II (TFIIS), central domain family protein [Aspergillus niger]|uniref:Transcription factor S-II (TFIIS), central domain family protein n=1 Tax=Aspergillus niger TaxID=5061 RepID=A0A254UMZ4_ASPNG|nr:hypothetical protein CBS147345_5020 [Aspergillus niger]TPR04744.1 Transcription factor S-II (TFIIS), central domain family protein [Aspergillus niger]SPB51599.1 unnamed protein product [Aspergillus niger]